MEALPIILTMVDTESSSHTPLMSGSEGVGVTSELALSAAQGDLQFSLPGVGLGPSGKLVTLLSLDPTLHLSKKDTTLEMLGPWASRAFRGLRPGRHPFPSLGPRSLEQLQSPQGTLGNGLLWPQREASAHWGGGTSVPGLAKNSRGIRTGQGQPVAGWSGRG